MHGQVQSGCYDPNFNHLYELQLTAMRIIGVFLLSLDSEQFLPFLYHVLKQDIF